MTSASRPEKPDRGNTASRSGRPREAQDGLNHYLYHPLSWRLALFLERTPLTPNMVSVIGGCFVISAGVAYYQPWGLFSAALGLILHMTWHVFDGADGDLARMTGRSSPKGEAIDGFCDHASHVVLYVILAILLDRQIGPVAWVVTSVAGASHAFQTNHVEVQKRQYLWWVYGTPWLRNTSQAGLAAVGARRGLTFLVAIYLSVAGRMTPHALKVDARIAEMIENGSAGLMSLREMVRHEALPLLRLCKLLGPNSRAIVLGLSMMAGSPLYYFIYEAVILNILLVISVAMHNRAAARIAISAERFR